MFIADKLWTLFVRACVCVYNISADFLHNALLISLNTVILKQCTP